MKWFVISVHAAASVLLFHNLYGIFTGPGPISYIVVAAHVFGFGLLISLAIEAFQLDCNAEAREDQTPPAA